MKIKAIIFFTLLFIILIGMYFIWNKIRPDRYIKYIVLLFGLITIMIPNFKDFIINYL
jgi:hypothetical protein